MITIKALKALKKTSDSKLKKDVIRIAINEIDGSPEIWFQDVMAMGSRRHLVPDLIYPVKFFKKHRDEILEIFTGNLPAAEDFEELSHKLGLSAFDKVLKEVYENLTKE